MIRSEAGIIDRQARWIARPAPDPITPLPVNAECQNELARLYYTGTGVQRDVVEAYKWLLLAGREMSAARRNIDVVERNLSYDQMSEGVRRYQMWAPSKGVSTPEPLSHAK